MSTSSAANRRSPQSTPTETPAETIARETFQVLLSALSNPGHQFVLPGISLATRQACQQIGFTLLDLESSFYTPDLALADELLPSGARPLSIANAAYLFFPDSSVFAPPALAQTLADLERVTVGTITDPDDGATLIIGCRLGEGRLLRLRGPGIQHQSEVRVADLPLAFWQLRATKISYPLGIDLFLVDGGQVIGLPRSTVIELE
jgi:alpha-D-ribose 1-methylphosphonate 5-triphosphate synthase subunit PhnH